MSRLLVFRTIDLDGCTTRIVQIDYFTSRGAYYYVTHGGVISFDAVAVNGGGDLGAHMVRWIANGDTIVKGW